MAPRAEDLRDRFVVGARRAATHAREAPFDGTDSSWFVGVASSMHALAGEATLVGLPGVAEALRVVEEAARRTNVDSVREAAAGLLAALDAAATTETTS
jgi:hypothetical protein